MGPLRKAFALIAMERAANPKSDREVLFDRLLGAAIVAVLFLDVAAVVVTGGGGR